MDDLISSYYNSLLVAKSAKPPMKTHLSAIQEDVITDMHSDVLGVIHSIPLSNDAVAMRINMMASDVEKPFVIYLLSLARSLRGRTQAHTNRLKVDLWIYTSNIDCKA